MSFSFGIRLRSSWLLALALLVPSGCIAQSPDLVYISNVDGVGEAGPVATVEEQAALALDRLGERLQAEGLGYEDVVVVNVFLRDARHFQAMNGVYRTYFETNPPTRATVQADLMDPRAHIQLSVIAARGAKEVIAPSGLQSPALPYSWGIRAGNALFIAGATARDPETYQPVGGDVPTQTRRIFGNIGMVLEEAGMSYEDLALCRVFLDDARSFGAMNGAYAEFVPEADPPARATVRAMLMNPVFSTEIQCIAVDTPARAVVRPEARGRSPYSPGIDVGDRVFTAGYTGRGTDAAEEARVAMDAVRATLEAASLSFDDVEDVWVYLADVRDWDAVRAVLEESMGSGGPEPTVVGTRTMGRAIVEIQVTARR